MSFSCNKFWFPKVGLGIPNTISIPPEEGEGVEMNVIFVVYVFQENFNIIAELRSAFSYRDSCVIHTYSLLFPFLCECFSILSLPFCFLSYLNVVYNNLEFILNYASSIISNIHQSFLLKLIHNSFFNALCWCSIHILLFHQIIINWLWSSGYLSPVLKSLA